jgi:hypothetical protein
MAGIRYDMFVESFPALQSNYLPFQEAKPKHERLNKNMKRPRNSEQASSQPFEQDEI